MAPARLPRLLLLPALCLAAWSTPAPALELQFQGREVSVQASDVETFLQPRFPQRYAPLGPLVELTLSRPRLQFPPGQRLQLSLDLAVKVGQSEVDVGTALLSSALRYDATRTALMLDQPRLEDFRPRAGSGGLDANGRELVNAWLADYARTEPVYRLDPAVTAMLGGMQVQDARIRDGRLVLEFDREVSGLGGRPRTRAPAQRLGWSIVPVHLGEPHRQAQIFFSRGVWRSARTMP
jgi:hypothetical protein